MSEGWRKAKLAELASIERGVTWSKDEERDHDEIGFRPVLRIGNIQRTGLDLNEVLYLETEKAPSRKTIAENTVLMVGSNGNPDRVGNVCLLPHGCRGWLYASFLVGFSPNDQVDPKFLFYLLSSDEIQSAITVATSGSTGLKNISLTWLRELKVAVPPFDIQHRIVDLISKVDDTIANGRKSEVALRGARMSLLNDLIGSKRARSEGWSQVKLAEVSQTRTGRTPKANDPRYWEGGDIPFLKIGDLTDGPVFTTKNSVTEQAVSDCSLKAFLPGTVVFAMYGATIGKFGIVRNPMVGNQAILAIETDPQKLIPEYLTQVFAVNQSHLRESGFGAAQKNLSQGFMRDWSFDLPPLREQNRIIAVMSSVEDALRAQRAQNESLEQSRAGLLSVLLSGEHEISDSYDRFMTEVG